MKFDMEKLAIEIYETRYEYLTPLQKEELRKHIEAKERMENMTQDASIDLLFRGCFERKASIDTARRTKSDDKDI